MDTITSRKNQIITRLRALGADRAARDEAGEFLCDGEKLLREALLWGAEITTVLWAAEPTAEVPGAAHYRVPADLLSYVSPLKTAAGVGQPVGELDQHIAVAKSERMGGSLHLGQDA